MKRIIVITVMIFLTFCTDRIYAQHEELSSKIEHFISGSKSAAFAFSFGGNSLYSSEDIEGGPTYSGREFYSLEAQIIFKLSDRIDIVPGISFIRNLFYYSPAFKPTLSEKASINVFSIPLYARYHFLKFLFLGGGLTINVNGGDRDLNGIGAGIQFGGEFNLNNGMFLTFSPFIRTQGLLPWKNYKLTNTGVTLSIGYKIK